LFEEVPHLKFPGCNADKKDTQPKNDENLQDFSQETCDKNMNPGDIRPFGCCDKKTKIPAHSGARTKPTEVHNEKV